MLARWAFPNRIRESITEPLHAGALRDLAHLLLENLRVRVRGFGFLPSLLHVSDFLFMALAPPLSSGHVGSLSGGLGLSSERIALVRQVDSVSSLMMPSCFTIVA